MSRRVSVAIAIAALLLVLGVLALTISPVMNPPKWDEFIVVYDAQRILEGQVPYRDFFNFIPPGIFVFLALVFKAAGGATLTAGRYASAGVMLGTFFLLSWSFRRKGWPLAPAVLWAGVVPVSLYGFWAIPSHHWLCVACVAVFLVVLARPGETKGKTWWFAGVAVGLAGLFMQTLGVALLAAMITLLLLAAPRKGRAAILGGLGVLALWGPILSGLWAWGALGPFFQDVILWPARNYSREGNENAGAALQDLPWRLGDLWAGLMTRPSIGQVATSVAGFVLYGALILGGLWLLIVSSISLGRMIATRRLKDPWTTTATLATFLLLGLGAQGNANWLHLVALLAVVGPLWIVALGDWSLWNRLGRGMAVALLGALLAAGGLYGARGLWSYAPKSWEWRDVDRPIREQVINRFLRSPGILVPGDTIAAFPEGGEVYLYSAPAAVGYTYFRPLGDCYNSLEDHRVVARQLAERRPRLILVPPEMEQDYLEIGSPVAEVMTRQYRRLGIVGNAVVYKRGEGGKEKGPR